jgi:hypothetical protein
MKLAWGSKVDADFRARIRLICFNFKWPAHFASWLMACIAFETGETFSPSIKNAAGSGATGLIQFMPKTARGLGTSDVKLERMTAVEQLDYVEAYFKPYARRIRTLSDMYMAILAPAHIGKPDDEVLYNTGLAYKLNAPLDIDQDGAITKEEAAGFVSIKLKKGLRDPYGLDVNWGTEQRSTATDLINEIEERLAKLREIV